jgi:hypothetical protein
MFTDLFVGVNVYLVMLGVTIYAPLGNPVKVKLPLLSVIAVLLAAPLRVIVTPATGTVPPLALLTTVPEME